MTTSISKKAQWPTHSDELSFSTAALSAHFEYREALSGRARHLAEICLNENLFEETFIESEQLQRGWGSRKPYRSYWGTASIENIEYPDSIDHGEQMQITLSTYIGYGEYDTVVVSLPIESLSHEDLEAFCTSTETVKTVSWLKSRRLRKRKR